MGVVHVNEACLENGYVVDIYIPEYSSETHPRGLVIELDGPFHFDSYMHRPLGPARMKKRHLSAMGYVCVSLPYWEYHMLLPEESKRNVLYDAMSKYICR